MRWILLAMLLGGCWDNFDVVPPDLATAPVNDLAVPRDLSAHD